MHKIFDDIEKKSVGEIVFDVLDPFGEYSAPSKDTKEIIKDVINEKMYLGRGELRNMYNGIMRFIKNIKSKNIKSTKDFSRIGIECMVEAAISNIAENWMTVFQNLPRDYEERIKAEWLEKKRQKRRKDREVCLYKFIDDFRTGKKQILYDVLKNIPIQMVIYHPEKMGKKYQLDFIIYRIKQLDKVILKTARYILDEEEKMRKKKRKGEVFEEAEIRMEVKKNSIVEDIFGFRGVCRDLSLKAKIIEFLYNNKNYIVIDDEDYYKNPKKEKLEYKAHHITLQSRQSWDYIELQFLTLDDFLNNDCWKLNHPNKDVQDFNRLSKDRRFKEIYRRGEFLLETHSIS